MGRDTEATHREGLELAELIRDRVGSKGWLAFHPSKPDGTPRKLLDISRMKQLGWQASIPLSEGLAAVYAEYAQHFA